MPIYEYECKQCGQRHEIMQKMSDPPITTCVACNGEVYRMISPAGLSFKGEGWYITDYARKGKDLDANPKNPKKEPSVTPSEGAATTAPTTSCAKKETAQSPSPEKTVEKKDKKELPKDK